MVDTRGDAENVTSGYEQLYDFGDLDIARDILLKSR